MTTYCGAFTLDWKEALKPPHFAPERLNKTALKAESSQDVYGLAGSFKFLIDPTAKLTHEIIEKEWYLSSIFGDDAELLSLLESCLSEDPKKRIYLLQLIERLEKIAAEFKTARSENFNYEGRMATIKDFYQQNHKI